MSKVTKIYQLLKDLELSTCFMVNGSTVSVTFGNGVTRPFLQRGRFATDTPDLQAAIESDNGYGTLFTLVETLGAETKPLVDAKASEPEVVAEAITEPVTETVESEGTFPPVQAEVITDKVPEPEKAPEPEAEKVRTITDYPEVTNLQEARQKMFELFPGEFKPANLPNKPAVLNRAKEKSITFSKLV